MFKERKCVPEWTDVLTPPYHQTTIHHNAVLWEKPEVTLAALEVTHEAAQMKLEIQYVGLPLTGDGAKKDFFLFQEVSSCRESWPFTLLKCVRTGICKTGRDLLKGQDQLKTHVSSWTFYYQQLLWHYHDQGVIKTSPAVGLFSLQSGQVTPNSS